MIRSTASSRSLRIVVAPLTQLALRQKSHDEKDNAGDSDGGTGAGSEGKPTACRDAGMMKRRFSTSTMYSRSTSFASGELPPAHSGSTPREVMWCQIARVNVLIAQNIRKSTRDSR